ncbi:benzoylformate decarboxylase [Georgenia alba]|uniref:Benzoylformate decarboxylase n=1 Tax=Georgenia alba TaxID=2233858 RepID=A0ABW2QAX9_9MICO
MATIREVTYDILRAHGLTTIFGNPGSNELTFLDSMPDDFRYVLGLHEGVVLGMADGFAQATGRPAFVNLHAAAGTGNALGVLTNSWNAHTPLVITAGQQVRSQVGTEAMLSNVDAPFMPRPLVKWGAEPLAAVDVPRTISQAIHTAATPPTGPVYVSVPLDDWRQEAGPGAEHLPGRTVAAGGALAPQQVQDLAAAIDGATNPVLVLGAGVDAARANDHAVALAERLRAPVWVAPSPSRCPFPTRHPLFRGVLPASIGGITRLLDGHDLVVVAGAPVFRYHQYEPGEYLPEGASLIHLTDDPAEAARAPTGRAVVGDVAQALEALAGAVTAVDRPAPGPRVVPEPALDDVAPLGPATVFRTLDDVAPDDVVVVKESTSTTSVFWELADLHRQGSYYFPAAGGLGWGMGAAVGVQLAQPGRRVVAVIGDGSANYAITALWSAAQYRVPVTFVVLVNGTYGALRSFTDYMGVEKAPGIDVPGIDFVSIATGYGVAGRRVASRDELHQAFHDSLTSEDPTLIEVPTASVNPFA